jgi:hypothetical protein
MGITVANPINQPYVDRSEQILTEGANAFRNVADNPESSAADIAMAAAEFNVDIEVASAILKSLGKYSDALAQQIRAAMQ